MNDTSPGAEKRFHELLMAKSGAQRLAMGCAMFSDAKRLALAGLRAQNKDEPAIKRLLFLRFYGQDFPAEKTDKILGRL